MRPIMDFSDLQGFYLGKRALEVVASGNHNLFILGNTGTEKVDMAHLLFSILPNSTLLDEDSIPFLSPHYSSSLFSMVGGGRELLPGQIPKAHGGILFLDDLLEFSKILRDRLRRVMEEEVLTVFCGPNSKTYLSKFLLVTSAKPCPCGYSLGFLSKCSCDIELKRNYLTPLYPVLEFCDVQLTLSCFDVEFPNLSVGENSKRIRERVKRVHDIQFERQGCFNSDMATEDLRQFCELSEDSYRLLKCAGERLRFTSRMKWGAITLSRTIADMDHSSDIQIQHLAEAIQLRQGGIRGL